MKKEILRLHITGASGSGTTTLGKKLSQEFSLLHLDTDDIYWKKTKPPYTQKREMNKRIELIENKIQKQSHWVISGSLSGWGDFLIPVFTHVIFLWVPWEIRKKRLSQREKEEFGEEALKVGGMMYQNHQEFLKWASLYDHAGLEQRSRLFHEEWFKTLTCPLIRVEGNDSLEKVFQKVSKELF